MLDLWYSIGYSGIHFLNQHHFTVHQAIVLDQFYLDKTHIDASYIPFLWNHKLFSKLNLCMWYPNWLHQTNRIAFWWILHTHTEWVPEDPASTHHFGRNVQNLENPSLTLGYFSLKAAYISHRLHRTRRFCLWTPFTMQTVFFTTHLATKLIILIHAKHKINGILGYHFSLFLCRLRKNSFNLFKFLCSSH